MGTKVHLISTKNEILNSQKIVSVFTKLICKFKVLPNLNL